METIMDNIPMISKLIQDYQSNPSKYPVVQKPETIVIEEPSVKNTFVHDRVTCDGCGVKPIVGNKWKCSVCEDFDYCDKCERTIEHAHPFLKIRNSNQAPVAITVILPEEKPIKK